MLVMREYQHLVKKMEKEFDRNIVVRAYFEEIMQVSEILYKEQK